MGNRGRCVGEGGGRRRGGLIRRWRSESCIQLPSEYGKKGVTRPGGDERGTRFCPGRGAAEEANGRNGEQQRPVLRVEMAASSRRVAVKTRRERLGEHQPALSHALHAITGCIGTSRVSASSHLHPRCRHPQLAHTFSTTPTVYASQPHTQHNRCATGQRLRSGAPCCLLLADLSSRASSRCLQGL